MRRLPSTLVAVAAAVALTATPAAASGCPLLIDPAGDARWLNTPVTSPLWDIRSADLASGPTTVAVVLRVGSLAAQGADAVFVRQTGWTVGWDLGGARHSVEVRGTSFGGVSTGYYERWDAAGPVATAVPVTLDQVAGTITWTVPRSAVPDLATPGAAFSDLAAVTTYLGGSTDIGFTHGLVHTDGDPGCVSAA